MLIGPSLLIDWNIRNYPKYLNSVLFYLTHTFLLSKIRWQHLHWVHAECIFTVLTVRVWVAWLQCYCFCIIRSTILPVHSKNKHWRPRNRMKNYEWYLNLKVMTSLNESQNDWVSNLHSSYELIANIHSFLTTSYFILLDWTSHLTILLFVSACIYFTIVYLNVGRNRNNFIAKWRINFVEAIARREWQVPQWRSERDILYHIVGWKRHRDARGSF